MNDNTKYQASRRAFLRGIAGVCVGAVMPVAAFVPSAQPDFNVTYCYAAVDSTYRGRPLRCVPIGPKFLSSAAALKVSRKICAKHSGAYVVKVTRLFNQNRLADHAEREQLLSEFAALPKAVRS